MSDLIGLTGCPQGSFMLLKVVRFCPFWRLNDTPLCEYGSFLARSCTDGRAGHFHVRLHVRLAMAELLLKHGGTAVILPLDEHPAGELWELVVFLVFLFLRNL